VIVVSNTSPIINLAAVGELDLLQRIYGELVIPKAVYDEIVLVGDGQPGAREVKAFKWIKTIEVRDRNLLTAFQTDLHMGEAEAIVLAIESGAQLLLMDERRARKVATKFGIRTIGLLGVLVQAKQKSYINAIKPILDNLKSKAGFWIGQELYGEILKIVEE
jgi:predicted nucleic acid-binding protein